MVYISLYMYYLSRGQALSLISYLIDTTVYNDYLLHLLHPNGYVWIFRVYD